ncbi:MAG: hypothetical protein V7607_6183 [Solirubrobacteraceae bacterium]
MGRDGAASRCLHQHVKVGDLLDAAAPRGSFVLRDGTRPVVLIRAGVGATPVLAMLHALARDHSPRPIWWVHGARNRDEHAFGAEVDALLGGLGDGHRVVAYSQPGGGEGPGRDYDVCGRLDLAVLDRAEVPKDARELAARGAEIVRADLDDVATLRVAARSAGVVFAAGSPHWAGPPGEARHGVNVAQAAADAGVGHLVFSSPNGRQDFSASDGSSRSSSGRARVSRCAHIEQPSGRRRQRRLEHRLRARAYGSSIAAGGKRSSSRR